MFSQNGLSLDQAPPISVVFRFFFSGALFGILAGILILFFQTDIFDPSSLEAVILTHTLTLGVMLSFMFAALFQMLPVIAGVTLQSPMKKANLVQYPFILGVLLLLFAFNFSLSWLFVAASILLGSSILYIVTIMLKNLLKLPNHSSSSKGMLVSLISLAIVIILALYLTTTLAGILSGEYYSHIKESHYSFGLFGWIALLIISISFQVIEMFYVTPAYPKLVSQYLPLSLFIMLLIATIGGSFNSILWLISNVLLVFVLSFYALLTLKRLTQRKRPLTDATVWFWRMGLSSLILSMLCVGLTLFIKIPTIETISYILFASFALSIVFAMFYKIVPFLTWFHLNSQGYFTAPMMHEVIHPKTAKKHLYIHLATVISFIISIFIPQLIFLAAVLTVLSFGWMGYQIIHAHLLYKKTQKTGEKFSMNMENI
jgi:MFS family permease